MKNISRLAPILALAACATAAPQKPTAIDVDAGRQETRAKLSTTTEVAPDDFWLDDEVNGIPQLNDPEMKKLMEQIADEIERAQKLMEEMKKAVDELGLPSPQEPIPDEIIPNN
ncbi:MAG: hypothetical protein AAB739_02035 [Patescibacteria group bacterium]